MDGRRGGGRGAKRFGPYNLGGFAACQLVLGIVCLMVWTFLFGVVVEEVTATGRAAKGEGIPGTFTAQSEACAKSNCSWYGTFTTDAFFELTPERVELRGDGGRSVQVGEEIPALDVGSGSFVQVKGGPPEWGEPLGVGFLAALAGSFGFGLTAMVVWGVYWTRAAPASRRRSVREHGGPGLRGLTDRDRWIWSARPGTSVIRVKVARSAGRTLAAAVGLLLLAASPVVFELIWAVFNKAPTRTELAGALWYPVFGVVLVGVAVQTFRLVLLRPRIWVTDDEIVIWDALLLWKVLRIPRGGIAAIHYGDEPRRREIEDGVLQLTPFREELNLTLEMRDDISLPARRLRWGNWFWVMVTLRNLKPQTDMPQRGRRAHWLSLRVKKPRRMATDLDHWLAEDEALPAPEFAPIDHAYYGTVRTHHGTGTARVKIKGTLPQPVLAEFGYDGPGTLRAWLRRTEFGRGTRVAVCGPEAPSATIVLDDRPVFGKALTKRYLHVESEGPWTVTISGPDRARAFTGSATGSGAEVLRYQGPAGIAVVTCPDGQPHQVRLYGPNLVALPGCDPVVSTAAGGEPSPAGRSRFALPAQAVLQIRAPGADWRIDVTPLEQADADGPGRVRPFDRSIAGDRTAVVRYLGPPGPVLFRSGDAFGVLELDAALTPVRTLATPDDGDTEFHLRTHALLQVTGGHGTWSLEEAHLPPRERR
ncbi:hypothetical protein [Actinomadura chokoriensis]|uniref:hypothetical protein n=1 Tax=Actinomadura chokoriensis TaxID=454156 RepID=UPI0031F916ED